MLHQNDEFGKDYLRGFIAGLGDKAKTAIVAQASYELTDATVDSQTIALKASGADTFFNISTPKFAAQAIRKAAEMGWKPTQYLASVSISVGGVMKPAGVENGIGVISAAYVKDPADARWHGTKEFQDYASFMKQYYPAGDISDQLNALAYSKAQTLVQVFRQAGDDLTRENVMKQAARLSMTLPMLYPGIDLTTTPQDFQPLKRMQPVRFNGTIFEPFGPVLGG